VRSVRSPTRGEREPPRHPDRAAVTDPWSIDTMCRVLGCAPAQ